MEPRDFFFAGHNKLAVSAGASRTLHCTLRKSVCIVPRFSRHSRDRRFLLNQHAFTAPFKELRPLLLALHGLAATLLPPQLLYPAPPMATHLRGPLTIARASQNARPLQHGAPQTSRPGVKQLAARNDVVTVSKPADLEQRQQEQQQRQPQQSSGLAPATSAAATPLAAEAARGEPSGTASLFQGALPKLALLGSAFLWGSYAPAVRLLYTSDSPPDSSVIMAVRGILQAGVLVAVSLALQQQQQQQQQQQTQQTQQQEEQQEQQLEQQATGSSSGVPARGAAGLFRQWLSLDSPPLWMAALELGLWNFSATALQVRLPAWVLMWFRLLSDLGHCAALASTQMASILPHAPDNWLHCSAPLQTISLQLISATRASFLVQATLLLTPLLSAASGHRPARQVWAGCALALAGCLLITADEASADVAAGAWDHARMSIGEPEPPVCSIPPPCLQFVALPVCGVPPDCLPATNVATCVGRDTGCGK